MNNEVLVLVVVFALLTCSGNLMANERRGAELVVQQLDGKQVKGELIAVKPSSLLLLDSQTGVDVSVEIGEIAVVKIIKKSKAWTIGAVGLGVGSLFGFITLSGLEGRMETEATVRDTIFWMGFWGAVCAVPGMLVGAILGIDKTIQMKNKAPEEIKAVLEKLRTQARITNFQ